MLEPTIQEKQISNAEMKLKELELKKQLASEVNPSLKDIQTIQRRINNLQSKLLIQDIEKNMRKAEVLTLDGTEDAGYTITPILMELQTIAEYFNKLSAKINLRLENL